MPVPDSERVFVSRALMDTTLTKGFTADIFIKDSKWATDAMHRNGHGEPLPADRFPKEIYHDGDGPVGKLPDLFNAGGVWVVSAACADILRRFELGRTSLYPTKLFLHDRKTPIDGDYFCINFGERKEALLPERSNNLRSPWADMDHPIQHVRKVSLAPKDFDVAVRATALAGPAIWFDPLLRSAFFVSGPLAAALKAAKMARNFGLYECRVIRDN